jgi:plastocyanin
MRGPAVGERRRGRARVRGALICVLLGVVIGGTEVARAADVAKTHTVVIDGLKYTPETLTVRRGETVVWVNKDPFPHTVTAKGFLDSRDIAAGKSWKFVARKPGKYAYICTLHPTMKGTLRVE